MRLLTLVPGFPQSTFPGKALYFLDFYFVYVVYGEHILNKNLLDKVKIYKYTTAPCDILATSSTSKDENGICIHYFVSLKSYPVNTQHTMALWYHFYSILSTITRLSCWGKG